MELKPEIIDNLITYDLDFKKKWYKTLLVYESYANKNL